MEIIIQEALTQDKNTIQNLACFYTYDMSRYCGFLPGWETPENGFFTCFDLSRYWEEPNRHPFLIRVDRELAGFALVHKMGTTKNIDWTIGEFFIVAKFQNKGVGRKVAEELFNRFPGTWEVMQIPENTAAINFWEKVICSYTGSNYTKLKKEINEPCPHQMIVMTFSSKPS